ncbi:efflux transporter outer membrane subunit [Rhodoferax aquaticus]|uniref:Efflux transporter outer membrane subunit n=2 Tax=Rhodoferax aquaticus TaxID=2527691 RepID=A0A515ERJ5_9BURK|nr:efflux transporter outer membrane subunit [Rhodoferax aquaticus]
MHLFRRGAVSAAALALSACASFMPPTQVEVVVAPKWEAPLPHQGAVGSLAQWWQQQGDPLLVELITAAQTVSPSVSQALTRIESSRANQALANSALLPNVSAQASASRGVSQPNVPVSTNQQIGLQAAWELDLVGANRAVSSAAVAQLEGTQAQWHDARVSVAAEVANLYFSLSTCHQLLGVSQNDAASRQETARLTDISARAGFVAPSVAAMARASAADGKSRVTQQAAQCDITTKGLVALTAISEPELRKKLTQALVKNAQAAPISVALVPAQTVSQRPDVFAAERDVVVASAQVGSAKAQRYPRLSLNGSIGALRVSSGGVEQDVSTWSFGPLALSLPLFDAGQRAAGVKSAQAAYQNAVVAYQGKVRNAVREVEEALVHLQSTDARSAESLVSSQGYAESLAATQARFNQGLASLVELEDARRNALASESAVLALRLERNQAWVALYRALGGGFDLAATQAAVQ